MIPGDTSPCRSWCLPCLQLYLNRMLRSAKQSARRLHKPDYRHAEWLILGHQSGKWQPGCAQWHPKYAKVRQRTAGQLNQLLSERAFGGTSAFIGPKSPRVFSRTEEERPATPILSYKTAIFVCSFGVHLWLFSGTGWTTFGTQSSKY